MHSNCIVTIQIQGGGTPMYAVLRSSSSVKVVKLEKSALTLDLPKIVLDSRPISSKFL